MEDTLSKFISESAKRHEENSNLIKEIRASTDAAIRNQGASIKTLKIQIGRFQLLGLEFSHANFFPLLYVNVMSKKFHNSIMKEKLEYKRNNVVGALMNIPIFLGTFSVMTDFAVLENMDAYRDEGMGDVNEKDEMNEISHPYQKLKGFYKGVLNLEPDYIRDAKMEEWLTRRHISVHEME
ncbi:hypothetical protein Tco_1455041 [Tanacetum coccineum]